MMPVFKVESYGSSGIRGETAIGAFEFPAPLVAHLVPLHIADLACREVAFRAFV